MRTVILIASLLASPSIVQAQATGWPNTRQGFWIGVGMGGGSVQLDCSYGCDNSDRLGGASGYVGAGGTLSPHVLLGGETNVWLHDLDFVGAASLVVMWYPSSSGASYLKVGVGGMRYTQSAPLPDYAHLRATAPSASLGVGYEMRSGPHDSLVLWVETLATSTVPLYYSPGNIDIDLPTSPPSVSINVVQAGLGFAWH